MNLGRPVAIVVLSVCAASARADELRLKDGRTFEGKTVARDSAKVVFKTRGGTLEFAADRVASLVEKPTAEDEYAERKRALAAGDPEAHVALARWCETKGLYGERRAELRRAVELDPEHAGARELLGEMKAAGRWMPREEALRVLGWKKRGGVWVTPEDARRLDAAEAEKRRREELQRVFTRLYRELFLGNETQAKRAEKELADFAKRHRLTELVDALPSIAEEARTFRTATVEVRAQQSQLTALTPRRISFGNGTGATLELPSTKTTTVRTTVGVPVGK